MDQPETYKIPTEVEEIIRLEARRIEMRNTVEQLFDLYIEQIKLKEALANTTTEKYSLTMTVSDDLSGDGTERSVPEHSEEENVHEYSEEQHNDPVIEKRLEELNAQYKKCRCDFKASQKKSMKLLLPALRQLSLHQATLYYLLKDMVKPITRRMTGL